MRKMYAGILILAVLLCAAVYNVHYLDSKMDRLLAYVDTAGTMAGLGQTDSAAAVLSQALSYWDSMGSYTHVFIRHSEIDATSDAFYDCLDCIQDGEADTDAALGKLRSHLCSIVDMEHLSLGSIF